MNRMGDRFSRRFPFREASAETEALLMPTRFWNIGEGQYVGGEKIPLFFYNFDEFFDRYFKDSCQLDQCRYIDGCHTGRLRIGLQGAVINTRSRGHFL